MNFRFLEWLEVPEIEKTLCFDIKTRDDFKQQQKLVRYFNQKKLKKLFVYSTIIDEIDLSFLKLMPNLEDLSITAYVENISVLYELSNLIELSINYSANNKEIDFAKLEHLKTLSCDFRDNQDNFDKLLNLEKLSIGYANKKVIEEINKLTQLSYLQLYKSKLNSLFQISELKKLETIKLEYVFLDNKLSFNYFHNLKKIELICPKKGFDFSILNESTAKIIEIYYAKDFNGFLSNDINELRLENVKVLSWDFLESLRNLEKLLLINCGEIPTIKFINNLPKLKFFCFVDTNVLDGDLTPCLKLDFAGTFNKRHYNLKDYQLPGYTKPTV